MVKARYRLEVGIMPDHGYAVRSSREIYRGRIYGLDAEDIEMPDGAVVRREVVRHPGAVIIAAVDDQERIVLVRQYRHPVRTYLWELPAGLLDVAGETAWNTAQRELYEEAQLRASQWHTLVDIYTSPGMTNEAGRIYLARGLTTVPEENRFIGQEEETDLTVERVDLDDAVRRVFAGDLVNGATVSGILSAAQARAHQWSGLRSVHAPWSGRPDRV